MTIGGILSRPAADKSRSKSSFRPFCLVWVASANQSPARYSGVKRSQATAANAGVPASAELKSQKGKATHLDQALRAHETTWARKPANENPSSAQDQLKSGVNPDTAWRSEDADDEGIIRAKPLPKRGKLVLPVLVAALLTFPVSAKHLNEHP
ncbi:hypothetical protein CF319_g877 [Tilletia indica]|nr:hypothetical protein CF319_g877 [Tilletia indica]